MAVYKQLKTKIDGVTTDVYPYTSPDAVLNSDGTTLQDTLDNLSNSVNNAVGNIKVDWNETDDSSVNYIHNKPNLDLKANVDSPEFTGIPQAPTADTGTNTNQIATTAFVQNAVANGMTATGYITSVEGDDYVVVEQTDTTVCLSHKDIDVENVYSNITLTPSSSFDAIKNIEVDETGHVVKIDSGTYEVPKEKVMVGATSTTDGNIGYVPAPTSGQEDYFLRGDGAWVEVNTSTASNVEMGQCYATCSSAEGSDSYTFAKNDFAFIEGGIVSIFFTNAVTAGSKLQELNTGSKPMYYNGSAITDGIISAGDTATFIYSNDIFHLIAINRLGGVSDGNTTYTLTKSGSTITLTGSDGSTTSVTDADNNTTYSEATSNALGLVKVGSNITNSSGTISITKDNVLAALGYTPSSSDDNKTYTLNKSGSTITLTGSDGSQTSVSDSDTTYAVATTSDNGLMSSTDKAKMDSLPGFVLSDTDPGVGTSVSYSENTLIFVHEE